jgi:CRP/FNR family transcriptional regulator, cyclic AMP receptor protein
VQEELGRLMVGSALGVWDAPVSRRDVQREMETLLAQVPLFAGLSRRHLGRVAGVVEHKHYLANSPLVRAGEPGDAFYVILDGEARVELPAGPVTLAAGSFFGEMAIIDGAPRSATVSAVTDLVVLIISRPKFLALLDDEPKVVLALLMTLAQRLREAQA